MVVTFTNAAATEMRERILNAIYKKLDENPNDINMQKQLLLINKANISTIHSFCLEVIRNNFFKINISPNFRLAEGTEIELLKMEVIEEVFDFLYESDDKGFLKLLNTYCSYRDDDLLKNLVLKIYNYIQSTPFPEEWLKEQVNKLNLSNCNDFSKTVWGEIIIDELKSELLNSINTLKIVLKELEKEFELEKYKTVILDDISMLQEIENAKKWDEIYLLISNIKFKTWPSDKKTTSNLKDKAKQVRDDIKKNISTIGKMFIFNEKQAICDILAMYEIVCEIRKIVLFFIEKFMEAKNEKNIIDFSDVEHYALKLLLEKDENDNYKPTDVAKIYKDKFQEIAIDEYQDISLVQEKILNSISRGNNLFMVGDIKQSIYKFRHARPELFKEKYENYGENTIQLYDNFRSKNEILNITNEVFRAIMTKKLGDIEYNESEFLRQGMEYPGAGEKQKTFGKPELDIINLKQNDDDNNDITLENTEIEAKFVAKKIKEILETGYYIYDKKEGYRKATFKDIAILLRTTSNVAPIYERELNSLEFPVFSDTQTNYFESMEIQTILSILKIIDNPNNDIPLVSVLRSPIGNFTDNELIEIRVENPNKPFYYSLIEFDGKKNIKLREKIDGFLNLIENFRFKQQYLSLDELIWYIYEKTGYYDYVSLTKNANMKVANLKMLFEKAKTYEQSSFRGLYNFINFIDRINKSGSDMGSPKLIGENDNVIRIMSIHKSKGLEFPIVFLCGTGKQFNLMDLNDKLLLHQDLGFGMQFIDFDRKIEYSTTAKEAVKIKAKEEILSEEMRLLYVALTRSREKLIITGVEKDLESSLQSKKSVIESNIGQKINKSILKKSKSYLDWLEMVSVYNDNFKEVVEIKYYDAEDIEKREECLKPDNNSKKNITVSDDIIKKLDFRYPFMDLTTIESKTSVSKLAKKEDTLKENMKKPKFTQNNDVSRAEIGTATHLVMQQLDFRNEYSISEIGELLEMLLAKNILTRAEKDKIDRKKILEFTKSKLYKRIGKAKRIYREKPFYISIPANQLYETMSKENILVQGIIDLYFIDENDKIVLVDYKTDFVKTTIDELIEKYRGQLNLYKNALENATNRNVDEVYIYSLYLNDAIEIKL